MSKTVLVFDFGASSARAMRCMFDGGRLLLEEVHRFVNTPINEAGHLRWDIDELFEQMKIGISFAMFNGGFDAISIDLSTTPWRTTPWQAVAAAISAVSVPRISPAPPWQAIARP